MVGRIICLLTVVLALILSACGVPREEEVAKTNSLRKPSIDTAVPSAIETATFSLG